MKKRLQQIISLILVALICCACSSGSTKSFGGKKNKSTDRPELIAQFPGREISFTFSALPSDTLHFSEESASGVLDALSQIQYDYPYESYYQLEEVKNRLDFDASVETHSFSALDATGSLSSAHLAELVKANNASFLSTKPFGYEEVEEDYIAELCDFIVKVVEATAEKYPDVDWARVYCNLGNLKILYDTGMLSYAEVSSDMILAISKNNTQIVLTMKGEDGFTRVMTHEIMHIIQIGCSCEKIENCGRRAGISVYWDDFSLNTTDWTWMVEGSAERLMCSLTGRDAVTYQYKMDYLCSLTMSTLLRDSVKADTMETLCLQSDPERLFEAFGCQTQAQRDELLKMMISLQVLQIQPKSFHAAYTEATGIDLFADEEAMNAFSYSLKPAICIMLAREFYENLVPFLLENQVSSNDLFFLISLFEGHLNQHLSYKNESKAQYTEIFFAAYRPMRDALFAALAQDNPDMDIAAAYAAYDIDAAGKGLLNATLSMLPAEKLAFLAERAQWQQEMTGLGAKVPQ